MVRRENEKAKKLWTASRPSVWRSGRGRVPINRGDEEGTEQESGKSGVLLSVFPSLHEISVVKTGRMENGRRFKGELREGAGPSAQKFR